MREFSFYQGFSLRRDRLAAMLQAVAENPTASDDEIGRRMGVNPYMVEGFQGWLCKTGLGYKEKKEYTLTPFGRLASQYDPDLNDEGTSWLLHFHLSTNHTERSEAWYRFFNTFVSPNRSFNRDEWKTDISRGVDDTPRNKSALEKDSGEVLKTYITSQGLGSLNLVQKTGKGEYSAGISTALPPLIAAFMVFDTWERMYSATDTIRLTQIIQEPEMLGKVIIAGKDRIQPLMGQLQGLGLVVMADTQHEPVTRKFQDTPTTLLDKYYQQL